MNRSARFRELHTSKFLLEEVHGQDAIDVARVISKKDTSERSEHAEEIATKRDRGFNTCASGAATRGGRWNPGGHVVSEACCD